MTAAADPPLSGLRARALRVGLVLGGVLALAVASRVSVPMVPVPMTLQTLAVFAIAGLAGPRLTFEIVLVWLLCAAIGLPVLPVLAGFNGGWQVFAGPTAGFLLAFLIAGPLVARFAPKAKGGDLFALFLVGHCLVLLLGWAWLAVNIGAGPAFMGGVRPFFTGVIVKSVAATIIVMLAKARVSRARKAT
jgi:biotin transport system substrate-specific component